MPKSWTPLEEVRLFWDEKTDTVKVTSSDPRLKGESFVLRLARSTHADELARNVLAEAGVEMVAKASDDEPQFGGESHRARYEAAKNLETHPTLDAAKFSPREIIVGYEHFSHIMLGQEVPVTWTLPTFGDDMPVTLGIFGKFGGGKTVLVDQILPQLAAIEGVDTWLFDAAKNYSRNIPQGIGLLNSIQEYLNLPSRTPASNQRAIIIDGYHADPTTTQRIMGQARSQCDIVIVTDIVTDHMVVDPDLKNFLQSAILIGQFSLRQRIALGVDGLGVKHKGAGILVDLADSSRPRFQQFYTYQPIEISPKATPRQGSLGEASERLKTHPPRQLSKHSHVIPLGQQDEEPDSRIDWDLRYFNDGTMPTVLGIFGQPGSGKTVLAERIAAHVARYPEDFDLYVCNNWKALEPDSLTPGTQITPHDLASLPSPGFGKKRRFVIIDAADTAGGKDAQTPSATKTAEKKMRDYIKSATGVTDIIVFTADHGAEWKSLTSHYVVLKHQSRVEMDSLGARYYGYPRVGEAFLIHSYEASDPEKCSGHSFNLFKP